MVSTSLSRGQCALLAVLIPASFAQPSVVRAADIPDAGRSPATARWVLSGESRGGVLIVSEGLNPNPDWVALPTRRGEESSAVLERIGGEMTAAHASKGFGGVFARPEDGGIVTSILTPPLFHGTESGLGIPAQPLGLSGVFDDEKGEFALSWILPPEHLATYDAIKVTGLGLAGPETRTYAGGTQAVAWPAIGHHPTFPDYSPPPSEGYFLVWGVKNGIPSPAAATLVAGSMTSDRLGHPHVDGVLPNWFAWSPEDQPLPVVRQIDEFRPPMNHGRPYLTPEERPFYQAVALQGGAREGGVARPLPGYGADGFLEIDARLLVPAALQAIPGWRIEFRVASTESPAALLVSRSTAHLSGQQLADSALLGVIDAENCPAYGTWFHVGPGSETASLRPCEMASSSGVPVLLVSLVGTGTEEVGLDWVEISLRR